MRVTTDAERPRQSTVQARLLSLPFTLAPLMVIGLVLLGIALLRAKRVPAWQAVLLVVGPCS